jgi:hypothetical protein
LHVASPVPLSPLPVHYRSSQVNDIFLAGRPQQKGCPPSPPPPPPPPALENRSLVEKPSWLTTTTTSTTSEGINIIQEQEDDPSVPISPPRPKHDIKLKMWDAVASSPILSPIRRMREKKAQQFQRSAGCLV